jgi:RHS repeat-associated protein
MVPVCTPHSPVPGLQPFSRLGNTALWAGVHRDPHTGWDWMGARVYLPALRQFLSRDPAGYAVSTDEWAYAPGDPWNFVDRTGWSPWKYGNDKQVGGATGGSRVDPSDLDAGMPVAGPTSFGDMEPAGVFQIGESQFRAELAAEMAEQANRLERALPYLLLAAAAYGPDSHRRAVEEGLSTDWRIATAAERAFAAGDAAFLLEQPERAGFRATLWINDDSGEVVLAFAGTDDGSDIRVDFDNGVGFLTDDYQFAVRLAETVSANLGSQQLTLVGHSLGGGLATAAGRATFDSHARPVVTLNAAGTTVVKVRVI